MAKIVTAKTQGYLVNMVITIVTIMLVWRITPLRKLILGQG